MSDRENYNRQQWESGGESTTPTPEPGAMVTVSMAQIESEPVEWLWPGRFPLGKLSIICGDPDVGKTFLTSDIAARASTGTPWPDHPGIDNPAGGVLFINGEDGLGDTIKPRLVAAGANLARVRAVPLLGEKGAKSGRWFTLADLPMLEKAIHEAEGCRVVFIDPASAFMGDKCENTNGEVRGLLGPLADLASRANVAIILVSHPSKSEGRRAIHKMLGSVGWVGAARAVWCVIRERDNEDRRLFLKVKNNLSKPTLGLAYTIVGDGDTGRVVWEDAPVDMTADEALAVQAKTGDESGKSALDVAVEWLHERLGAGEHRGQDVERDGGATGIKPRTLERARGVLNVKCRPGTFGGSWLWSLPPQSPPSPPNSTSRKRLADSGTSGGLRYGPGPETPEWAR